MNKLINAIKLGIVNWAHKISNIIVVIGDKDYLKAAWVIEDIY